MTDRISCDDLNAYVDDQLDPLQRIAVEDWLSHHPNEAAAVMSDLRLRHELRLLLPPVHDPRDAATARRMVRDTLLRPLLPTGLAASVMLAIWLLLGPNGQHQVIAAPPPPPFVGAAMSARDASELRLEMISQPEVLYFDAIEMRALTGIIIPKVPSDWVMRDVQIFPSPAGPGVAMMFDTPLHGRMSIFIVRSVEAHPESGTAHQSGMEIAWFSNMDIIYVLAGTGPGKSLVTTARTLASNLGQTASR